MWQKVIIYIVQIVPSILNVIFIFVMSYCLTTETHNLRLNKLMEWYVLFLS
jgi:hypothetical protein